MVVIGGNLGYLRAIARFYNAPVLHTGDLPWRGEKKILQDPFQKS